MQLENKNLIPGLQGEVSLIVGDEHTARFMGSGERDVLATPMLIALMEAAAQKAIEENIQENQQTVGIYLELAHEAATPVGMKVTAVATLLSINGRTLTFGISAFDERENIASGRHVRTLAVISSLDRLLQKKLKK